MWKWMTHSNFLKYCWLIHSLWIKRKLQAPFQSSLIRGNNFLILIFVQQYSTLGIETKVVKRKNTKNIHCSWKSHIYMVTKSLGDLLSKVHFLCVFFFFCCPAIAFVKLITLGWMNFYFLLKTYVISLIGLFWLT